MCTFQIKFRFENKLNRTREPSFLPSSNIFAIHWIDSPTDIIKQNRRGNGRKWSILFSFWRLWEICLFFFLFWGWKKGRKYLEGTKRNHDGNFFCVRYLKSKKKQTSLSFFQGKWPNTGGNRSSKSLVAFCFSNNGTLRQRQRVVNKFILKLKPKGQVTKNFIVQKIIIIVLL